MLNGLDRRLIVALQNEGRVTNVELAKRVGSHVSTVKKKVNQLEDRGLVKVRALPNPFKLGYKAHALIAIKADSLSIDNICESLGTYFHVNLIVTTFGRYDILAMTYYPTWEDLLTMLSTVLPGLDGIKLVDTFMVKEITKRQYSFSGAEGEPVKIDEIDQTLIEMLTKDGRLTYRQLAQKLEISPATCLRRVSRLLEEKVIEIRGVPYMSKIESVSNAFMFLQVDPQKLETVCDVIGGCEEAFLCMTMINGYSLVIGLHAENTENLFGIKKKILSLEGVIEGEIIVRAEIKKRYYGGFLKKQE